MKTIGFVDHYISEWHANNYPAWIKSACEKLGVELEVGYVWAEKYVSPVDGRNTDEWCAEFGVKKCETLEELCEKADYILVLAPSDPEKHLEYAKTVLKYRKNTYIDKTFAPDYATAKQIFDIAEEYGTSFFSSSALRYATELDGLGGSSVIATQGGGGSLEEYIVHQAEMLIAVSKSRPTAVTVRLVDGQYVAEVELDGGKVGYMTYAEGLDFSVRTECENEATPIRSDFFAALITDIVRFFGDGRPSFDTAQTLDVIKLREGAVKGARSLGEKIYL